MANGHKASLLSTLLRSHKKAEGDLGSTWGWAISSGGFLSWVQDSVTSVVKEPLSVDAWFSTWLDTEKVFVRTRKDAFHVFVAGVMKSFGAVDGRTLRLRP